MSGSCIYFNHYHNGNDRIDLKFHTHAFQYLQMRELDSRQFRGRKYDFWYDTTDFVVVLYLLELPHCRLLLSTLVKIKYLLVASEIKLELV